MPEIRPPFDDDYNIFKDTPGVYMIFNQSSGTVMDLYNGGAGTGVDITGWSPSEPGTNDHQLWQIASVGQGKYVLINRGTGTYVCCAKQRSPAKSQAGFPDKSITHFRIQSDLKTPELTTFSTVSHLGNVLELQDGASENATVIAAQTASPSANGQQWLLRKVQP